MKKVIVLGCPGAGKSTFARKLRELTGLPLHYLDQIWHKPDRTPSAGRNLTKSWGKFWRGTSGSSTATTSARWNGG